MAFKVIVSEHADELLDGLVQYLIYKLKNEQAAAHLLEGIEKVYDRLEENPRQFPLSNDRYLAGKGYHVAVIPEMDYNIIFRIDCDVVNVVGIYHQLENYQSKL